MFYKSLQIELLMGIEPDLFLTKEVLTTELTTARMDFINLF